MKVRDQIFAEIQFSNPANQLLESTTTKALVASGALFLCIPEHIALQLQLTEYEKREVTIADGSKKLVPYVGPIQVNYLNRLCLTGALVVGNMTLLGAIPIEDMDLVFHTARLKLTVNPENLNNAGAFVVRFPYRGLHPNQPLF